MTASSRLITLFVVIVSPYGVGTTYGSDLGAMVFTLLLALDCIMQDAAARART